MYRYKIQQYYEHLSPSYQKVADFIMGHYYDAAFMTAAQLADAVGVDTTTVVRFSQRLGYNGYPGLLQDIRARVKEEIYAVYKPAAMAPSDLSGRFKTYIEQEKDNLQRVLIHNPPKRVEEVARLLANSERIYLVAEGFAGAAAEITAQQLYQYGIIAIAVQADPVLCATALAGITDRDLVVGISTETQGVTVADALAYAHSQGCKTLGIISSLESPVHRIAEYMIYVPTSVPGPFVSVAALMAVLTALANVGLHGEPDLVARRKEQASQAYHFLRRSREDMGREELIGT